MNEWFSHGRPLSDFDTFLKPPEKCCSQCMESCINLTECEACLTSIRNNSARLGSKGVSKKLCDSLEKFLVSLHVNEHVPESVPSYCEKSLASIILENCNKFVVLSDAFDFLKIFNIDHEINLRIAKFVMKSLNDFSITSDSDEDEEPSSSDESEKDSSDEAGTDSTEYYDSE